MPAYGLGVYGLGVYGIGTSQPTVAAAPAAHSGLSVVLETPQGTRVITRDVSNLTIKNISPGGYASVEFDLKRRLDESRLSNNAQVRVYNTATAEQVGGGRVVEQGPSSDGTWHVSCLGEAIAAMQEIDEPYMVIDTNPEATTRSGAVGVKTKMVGAVKRKKAKKNNAGRAGQRPFKQIVGVVFAEAKRAPAPDDDAVEGLLFQFPDQTSMSTGAGVSATFRGPYLCGMTLGAYTYRHREGFAATTWKVRARSSTVATGGIETDRDNDWQTGLALHSWAAAVTSFDASRDSLTLDVRYIGAGGLTGTRAWAHLQNLIIRSRLYGADGALRSGIDHCFATVRAGEVFTDLIVRRCPTLKPGTVATGSHAFTQLAWYEPVTTKAIVDEITETDSTVSYHAWEADTDGRTPVHLTPLPTVVRYELTPAYGYSAPSSSSDVFTRCVVIGVDGSGYDRRIVVDRTPAGQSPRSQTIDLEEEFTDTVALEVANLFLDNHAAPPNSGTITVAQPVLDLLTGRYVHPAAVRSGELCRVRGVQPSPNSLNPDATQDGVTIFRIVSNSYSEDSGTASLELDSPVFDQDQAIADLLAG